MRPSLLTWTGSLVLALSLSAAGVMTVNTESESGHLILIVEGDATGLYVSHITAKPDPYNPVRHSQSTWSVAVIDENGSELGRFPVDLSHFDLDPAHVGQPLRVEGDVVRDTRVATLVSIPRFAEAEELVFHMDRRIVGRMPSENYSRMIGRVR